MTIKFAFLFPGQGSQYPGMGQSLADQWQAAAGYFAAANQVLNTSLSQLCWSGPEDELNDTYNTQPALLTTSIAAWAALQEAGFTAVPAAVAGHSLGEYSAYVAAQALDFADGLRLVRERGRLMHQAGEAQPGKMAAILKLDEPVLQEICHRLSNTVGPVQIANYNAPDQLVISGQGTAVETAMTEARDAGARRVVPLAVSIAAHSPLMAAIQTDFAEIVHEVHIERPNTPVISNITAKPLTSAEEIRTEMVSQLTASVQWSQSIKTMRAEGITHFIELGAKNVLTGLMRRIDRQAQTWNIEDSETLTHFLETLSHD